MEALRKMFCQDLPLIEEEYENCQALMQCHRTLSLEEGERGKTNLVHLEINTGKAPLKQQRP